MCFAIVMLFDAFCTWYLNVGQRVIGGGYGWVPFPSGARDDM